MPNVDSCTSMLYGCRALTSVDTTGWDTSNVTNMRNMFWNCNALTNLDVSKFNTSNVYNMYYMFYGCNSLTTLDISNWDTSNVGDMSYMFDYCNSLTTIKGVIDMKYCTSYDNMFYNCTKLTGVKIKNLPSSKRSKFIMASKISLSQVEFV